MNAPPNIPQGKTRVGLVAASKADEALAKFRAQWPAERCKRLGDAIIGTPAEKAAANASFVAGALEKRAGDTAADEAVRAVVRELGL